MALTKNSLAIISDGVAIVEDDETRGPGRPLYIPHPQVRTLVEVLVSIGASQEAICRELVAMGEECADVRTLQRAFAEELAHGKERRILGYGVKVHSLAMGNGPGALAACRYLLAVLGGAQWRVPREGDEPPPAPPDAGGFNGNGSGVHIVIPDNGRGFPEGATPNVVTIEGAAELAEEEPQP